MSDISTPLTALCNICHSAPPKYTCPRDKVRTCSLACSQSHKKRAACSGVRDPAAYVPKSALTTASGIDRDYNFLSGVERNLDQADRDVTERGVSLSGQGKMAFQKRWHDSGALARYLREHRIRVHRAPVGMARQKTNQTRFIQKSKRIVWSVEWVVEGEKQLAEVDERTSVNDAYGELLAEKEREIKKRKRVDGDAGGTGKKPKAPSEPEKASVGQSKQPSDEATAGNKISTQTEAESSGKSAGDESVPSDAPSPVPSSEKQDPIDQDTTHATPTAPPGALSETHKTSQPPQPKFYLHKPHTSSRNTVLVPLAADATLTSALTGRNVLEFPTIYVFPPSEQQDLPEGFMTDSQYVGEKTAEDKEVQELISSLPEDQRKAALGGAVPGMATDGRNGVSDWDDSKVLEVLKQDVDALKE